MSTTEIPVTVGGEVPEGTSAAEIVDLVKAD